MSSTPADLTPISSRQHRPTILDLMILTGTLAAMFAFQDLLARQGWFFTSSHPWFHVALRLQFAIGYGLPIAGCWLALRRFRGRSSFYAPGHFLLVFMGVNSLVLILSGLILSWIYPASKEGVTENLDYVAWLYLCYSAGLIVSMGFLGWVTRKVPIPWRIVFISLLIQGTGEVIMAVGLFDELIVRSNTVMPGNTLILTGSVLREFALLGASGLLVIAVIVDIIAKRRYDWLHWLAVLALFSNSIVAWIIRYLSQLFVREAL